MKYNTKNTTVEAIIYSGYNYKEISEFTGHKTAWSSSQMEWSDNYPPRDLQIILKSKEVPQKIQKGYYVVRLCDDEYCSIEPSIFNMLFEEEK